MKVYSVVEWTLRRTRYIRGWQGIVVALPTTDRKSVTHVPTPHPFLSKPSAAFYVYRYLFLLSFLCLFSNAKIENPGSSLVPYPHVVGAFDYGILESVESCALNFFVVVRFHINRLAIVTYKLYGRQWLIYSKHDTVCRGEKGNTKAWWGKKKKRNKNA